MTRYHSQFRKAGFNSSRKKEPDSVSFERCFTVVNAGTVNVMHFRRHIVRCTQIMCLRVPEKG